MVGTGVAHKAISILLRLGELASAIIVLGILSRFCYLISIAEVHADGRIIYGIVVACLGIIYSILFCPPFKDMFLGFPFDFVMFVMWLVAYCLLQTRTGGHACSARWYYDYWGYYWGRFWRVGPIGTVTINGTGCGAWKTVLAFSFIAWFLHLLSGILGVYVFRTYVKIDETKQEIKHQAEKLTKGDSRAHSYNQRAEQDNGTTDNV
ncbi:hypothetical protein FOXG_16189 [Fusarium oxysporum f. sp. lycopersici 4287]|uniref:MARVEL domain-containing protein n=2 Tax=Fusarium oxysporum f. sp. lycopersici (strain 4287 / CBS 123668 / FGSC 9935 / NRRL 34936) TaxID=426428 RepID=A0A0J9W7K3_FUSO4|nr:hypothetical protein FOXG_16189 [Fusarium oxysporum f. sp. lycopersici 4287]KNB18758.1 hypothetical protein FOXG_16189 [Fusarium oxysporum f. sp. lycopersici 4287]